MEYSLSPHRLAFESRAATLKTTQGEPERLSFSNQESFSSSLSSAEGFFQPTKYLKFILSDSPFLTKLKGLAFFEAYFLFPEGPESCYKTYVLFHLEFHLSSTKIRNAYIQISNATKETNLKT